MADSKYYKLSYSAEDINTKLGQIPNITPSTADNGKVLMVINGAWGLGKVEEGGNESDTTLYTTYYGVSSEEQIYNKAFLETLNKQEKNKKITSFSVNSGIDEYIVFASPVRFGICQFTLGSITGGFTLVDTIDIEVEEGKTEEYYIYRSDWDQYGEVTIKVS